MSSTPFYSYVANIHNKPVNQKNLNFHKCAMAVVSEMLYSKINKDSLQKGKPYLTQGI